MKEYLLKIITIADAKFDEGNGIIDDGLVYSSEDEDFEGSEWVRVEDHNPYD
jgi:hypothetical protein